MLSFSKIYANKSIHSVGAAVCTRGFRRLLRGGKSKEGLKRPGDRKAQEEVKPAPKPLKSCLKTPNSVPRNLRVRFEGVKSAWVAPSVRRKREEQRRLAKEKWNAPGSSLPQAETAALSESSILMNESDTKGSDEMLKVERGCIQSAASQQPSFSLITTTAKDEGLERNESILSAVAFEPLGNSLENEEYSTDESCKAGGDGIGAETIDIVAQACLETPSPWLLAVSPRKRQAHLYRGEIKAAQGSKDELQLSNNADRKKRSYLKNARLSPQPAETEKEGELAQVEEQRTGHACATKEELVDSEALLEICESI
jgi:hypothetical protein